MRANWRRIGVFVGIVALAAMIGVAGVAVAQGSEDGTGWPSNIRDKMHGAIANVLGISVEDYEAAVDTAYGQVVEEAVADGVLTQEQADRLLERMGDGFGARGMPYGPGSRGGRMGGRKGDWIGGWMGPQEGSPLSFAAEELNLDEDILLSQLRDGKTITEIAEAQGVDPQAIVDAYMAGVSDHLAEAVAEERITQQQADEMLSRMEEQAAALLNGSSPFGRAPGFERPEGWPSRDYRSGGRHFGRDRGMGRFGDRSAQTESL